MLYFSPCASTSHSFFLFPPLLSLSLPFSRIARFDPTFRCATGCKCGRCTWRLRPLSHSTSLFGDGDGRRALRDNAIAPVTRPGYRLNWNSRDEITCCRSALRARLSPLGDVGPRLECVFFAPPVEPTTLTFVKHVVLIVCMVFLMFPTPQKPFIELTLCYTSICIFLPGEIGKINHTDRVLTFSN